MTVHGAKGLEAPIVILPDTADVQPRERGKTIKLPNGPVVWKSAKNNSPSVVAEAQQELADAAKRESLRLMYVAMTRAQSWLIVGAAGKLKSHGSASVEGEETEGLAWYDRIKSGALHLDATVMADGGYEMRFGNWPDPEKTGKAAPEKPASEIPFNDDGPISTPRISTVSPSKLGGAKVISGEAEGQDGDTARKLGTGLHLLLEHLAGREQTLWSDLAASLIADPADCALCLDEAARVLTNPDLSHVFGPGTLAEVGVTADLDGTAMLGSIDRLIIEPGRVLAVDFKSNAIVPPGADQVPEGLVRQLAAYAGALRQIYPGRLVEVAILWTRTGTLMPLPGL